MPHTNEEQEKEWREWKNNFCQHISDWSYYSADDELEKMREILLQEARAQERKEVVEMIRREARDVVHATFCERIGRQFLPCARCLVDSILSSLETPEKEPPQEL